MPVTTGTRLFDPFFVPPIRLFAWLIFLGIAYTFVLQRIWDRIRTRMVEKTLRNHTVVCGVGSGGEPTVTELIRQGVDLKTIVAIDADAERTVAAVDLGAAGLTLDCTHNATLTATDADCARTLLVSPGRDDTAALVVLSARQLNPEFPISASVWAVENEDFRRQAGACSIINSASPGGDLLAQSSTHRGAVNSIRNLAAADGGVTQHERVATDGEVGLALSSVGPDLGVRLLRRGKPVGFWEEAADKVRVGDAIIEIVRDPPGDVAIGRDN